MACVLLFFVVVFFFLHHIDEISPDHTYRYIYKPRSVYLNRESYMEKMCRFTIFANVTKDANQISLIRMV